MSIDISRMEKIRSIIKSNVRLTPFKFYTELLEDVASFYRGGQTNPVAFKLFEKGDEDIYDSLYSIDPIVIPLLLSLFEQLSKFHKKKLQLHLYNNRATVNALEFLYKCDFFFVAGNNRNPTFPKGRNILDFDDLFFGAFKGKVLRNEHRVRAYSLDDDGLAMLLKDYKTEEEKRDFLISHYTYKVREQFQELLFDNEHTAPLHNIYIDILSELITNAVLHSHSNAFALMFVDRYKTKFSISDNGVGFSGSMKNKKSTFYYEPDVLKNILSKELVLGNISPLILNNLFTIFDALYYSALKDRHGIFDLMINVVLNSKGYFRIHCDNSQIIISNRMMDELLVLDGVRNQIYHLHNLYLLEQIDEKTWKDSITENVKIMQSGFVEFCRKAFEKYSNDIIYSSLRFFRVKLRGVHIEVEIPNTMSNDNLEN